MSNLVFKNIIGKMKELSSDYRKIDEDNQFRLKQMYLAIKSQRGLKDVFSEYQGAIPSEMKLNVDISHEVKSIAFSVENKGIKYHFTVENELDNEIFLKISQDMMSKTGETPAEKQAINNLIGDLRFIVKNSYDLERDYQLGRVKPMAFLRRPLISEGVKVYKEEENKLSEIKKSMSKLRSDMVRLLKDDLPEQYELKENLDLERDGVAINKLNNFGPCYSITATTDAEHFGLAVSSPQGLRTMVAYEIGLDSYNAISDAFSALKDIDMPIEDNLEVELNDRYQLSM